MPTKRRKNKNSSEEPQKGSRRQSSRDKAPHSDSRGKRIRKGAEFTIPRGEGNGVVQSGATGFIAKIPSNDGETGAASSAATSATSSTAVSPPQTTGVIKRVQNGVKRDAPSGEVVAPEQVKTTAAKDASKTARSAKGDTQPVSQEKTGVISSAPLQEGTQAIPQEGSAVSVPSSSTGETASSTGKAREKKRKQKKEKGSKKDKRKRGAHDPAGARTETEKNAKGKGKGKRKRRKWPWILLALIIVAGAAGAAIWYNFYRYDDVADIKDTWYVGSTDQQLVIDDEKIHLTDDIAYNYTIDPINHRITYVFGDMIGSGEYVFSPDRDKITMTEPSPDGRSDATMLLTRKSVHDAIKAEKAAKEAERAAKAAEQEKAAQAARDAQTAQPAQTDAAKKGAATNSNAGSNAGTESGTVNDKTAPSESSDKTTSKKSKNKKSGSSDKGTNKGSNKGSNRGSDSSSPSTSSGNSNN